MDRDMKKNRLFLVFLCGFSVCMVIYHVFLWNALNSPPAEEKVKAGGSGVARTHPAESPVTETRAAAGEAQAITVELRSAYEFEKNTYPALRKAIITEAGFDIPIEVDWPSLAAEGWSHIYGTAFPKVYFLPIVRALNSFAADTPDKNGLRRFLAKIVIRNSGRYFSTNGISYDDGALVIDLQPQANIDEEETERSNRILELLIMASGR